jgi:hypothetical protein
MHGYLEFMVAKVACTKCGAKILPTTAEETSGLCMPCKLGTRESIEASKQYYAELKKHDPFRELWKSLVHRVHKTDTGYEGLSSDERLYFSVSMLQGEVYNGGMDQYFWNSSGSMYYDALIGLEVLEAIRSRELLLRAKQLFFGNDEPPIKTIPRREAMSAFEKRQLSCSNSKTNLRQSTPSFAITQIN